MQLLSDVALAAHGSTSLEEASQTALDLACAYSGWPAGHIWRTPNLLRAGAGAATELVSSGVWHLNDPERFAAFRRLTTETPLPLGVGLPGRVPASGTAVWVDDLGRGPAQGRTGSPSACPSWHMWPWRWKRRAAATLGAWPV